MMRICGFSTIYFCAFGSARAASPPISFAGAITGNGSCLAANGCSRPIRGGQNRQSLAVGSAASRKRNNRAEALRWRPATNVPFVSFAVTPKRLRSDTQRHVATTEPLEFRGDFICSVVKVRAACQAEAFSLMSSIL